jgi:hypothetical protein
MSESHKPDSAGDPRGPAIRLNRSAAARRAARLNRAEREARIASLLNRGVAVAEIAAREGLSLQRMRNLVREVLAKCVPQPPAEFLALQVGRLNEAMLRGSRSQARAQEPLWLAALSENPLTFEVPTHRGIRNSQGGGPAEAAPHGPHAEEPRAGAASRSIVQLSATSVRIGASFEAASRRLRTRRSAATTTRKWRRKVLKRLDSDSGMAVASIPSPSGRRAYLGAARLTIAFASTPLSAPCWCAPRLSMRERQKASATGEPARISTAACNPTASRSQRSRAWASKSARSRRSSLSAATTASSAAL